MSIGIVGAGNMAKSIATRLASTAERVALADRDPAKAEAVVAEIGRQRRRQRRERGRRAGL